MTIDSKKCFDRIEHAGIIGALEYFNFCETFISYVQTLLTDFQLCTQNAGFTSEWFEALRRTQILKVLKFMIL